MKKHISAEEEFMLILKCQQYNDEKSFVILYDCYINFMLNYVYKRINPDDINDVKQDLYIILQKSILKFDLEKYGLKVRLSTYLVYQLRNYAAPNFNNMSIPIAKLKQYFFDLYSGQDVDADIVNATFLKSMDSTLVIDEDDNTLHDVIADDNSLRHEHRTEFIELLKYMKIVVDNDKYWDIFYRVVFLEQTLRSIGRDYNISGERVRQCKDIAIKRIKNDKIFKQLYKGK